MATWQFSFSLVPQEGIVRIHGGDVLELDEFRPIDKCNIPSGSQGVHTRENYWLSSPPRNNQAVIEDFGRLLPPLESWDADAVMFGFRHGHQVEIWSDDLVCRFDARDPDTSLLEKYAGLALRLGCRVVLHENGQVLGPDANELLLALLRSRAKRFVTDPESALKELRPNRESDRPNSNS